MPEGSVNDQLEACYSFSRYECKQIFAQTSDALAYLHTLDPQIVHRDIKPSNILILYRRPDDIFVKFADFGLSREGDNLMTICGTPLYLAPEIYEADVIQLKQRERYTALVDIWSLGVVVAQLQCGLPKNEEQGVAWCKSVRKRVETTLESGEDDLLSFVLQSMLCLELDGRKRAEDCHTEALRLLQSSNSGVSGGHYSDSLFEKDSLFCRSSFQDDSDQSYGDGRGSSSASTVVIAYDAEQDGGIGESAGPVLGVVAAPKTDYDTPSENKFRHLLVNALYMMEQSKEADAALSIKRSMDSAEQRTAKRNRTVTDV